MRGCTILMIALVMSTRAFAIDVESLPQTCKDTLAGIQQDKARFAQLGGLMTKYRRAKDTENFCKAERDTVLVIKEQNSKLEDCLGEMSSANVPTSTMTQMTQVRAAYRDMLAGAKDPKNDRFHCGLADQ